MKKILTTSILALAGVAFIVPAANAALNYSTTDSELVVAFSTTIAPPAHGGNTYLVDIGSMNQFTVGAPGSLADGNLHTINVASSLADIAAAGISTTTGGWSL